MKLIKLVESSGGQVERLTGGFELSSALSNALLENYKKMYNASEYQKIGCIYIIFGIPQQIKP